jgi:hypothetical protein
MPKGTYTKFIEEILTLDNELSAGDTVSQEYTRGIFNEIENSTANSAVVAQLKKQLDLLDSRRGTNWKETFPWLVNL